MSTAELERPLTVETPPFVMPTVKVNQEVAWYPNADRRKNPSIARVVNVWKEILELLVSDGTGNHEKESVRHVDDPYLVDNQHWRSQYGAWDFTPLSKQLAADKKAMEDRLATMESRIAELEKHWTEPQLRAIPAAKAK